MHRSLLIATPFVLTLFFAGCWVTFGEECDSWPFDDCNGYGDGDGDCDWDYDDCEYWGTCDDDGWPPAPSGDGCVPGDVRYCDTPTYCSWGQQVCADDGSGWGPCLEGSAPSGCGGFGFDEECCLAVGGCCQDWYDLDGDGDTNDSIGNCEEVPSCSVDADCPNGYCDIEEGAENGTCVITGICATDEHCAAYGPGLACDVDRHVCVPEEEPCPTGECGCSSDAECGDGLMCLASRCTPPESVCFFDFECGVEGVCVDNDCHTACADDAACPAGQTCQSGLCREPAAGIDGCVFDEDCGATGARCINATCFAACADSEDCADGESCRAGACRASSAPVHSCASDAACAAEMTCHRGVCRLPCVADINCGDSMDVCGAEGFCVNPIEVEPECIRAADCAEGQSCRSNSCTSL